MTRMGMLLLAVAGVLLAAGDAQACACKGQESSCKKAAAAEQAPKDTQAPQQASPEATTAPEESQELHAAKCQCGSAADCTCKKGKCQCPRCQKPKRQVVEPLQGQTQAPRLPKARYDASAGLFI